jgi:hypothetical protein
MRCKGHWSSQTVDRLGLSFSGDETCKDDEGDEEKELIDRSVAQVQHAVDRRLASAPRAATAQLSAAFAGEIDLGVHQPAGMNAQNLHGAAHVHGFPWRDISTGSSIVADRTSHFFKKQAIAELGEVHITGDEVFAQR